MFSGQGSQYVNMAAELYRFEPTFREQVNHCSEILKPHLGLDLRGLLYPADPLRRTQSAAVRQTCVTQPAPSCRNMRWRPCGWSGVRPHAMIGHSLGEVRGGLSRPVCFRWTTLWLW
jgi:acyl transferase domain-containing protein